jgi:hypothetical protein
MHDAAVRAGTRLGRALVMRRGFAFDRTGRYRAGGSRSRVSTSSADAIFFSRPIVGEVCKVSKRDSCARLTPAVSASRLPLQPCCLASDRICLAMCR